MRGSASPRAATAMVPATIPIACLGARAAALLRTESRWEVRAVFRRSFYCRSDSGAFVCVGPMSLGSGPLNVLYRRPEPIDWEAAGLTTDSAAVCDGAAVRVAERFTFRLPEARIWRPTGPSAPWQPAATLASLAELACEVRDWPARGGLQALIPTLGGNAPAATTAVHEASALLRMALGGIEPLGKWLATRLTRPGAAAPVPVSALDALLGLGPGLTPSGDDFLGGALIALHHLGGDDVAESLAAAALPRAEQRTNEISRAHLAAAAGGEGVAPLHAVLSSLCAPGTPRLGPCLSAVDAIGHTSGWDALAGVTFAAAIVARARAVRKAICASG